MLAAIASTFASLVVHGRPPSSTARRTASQSIHATARPVTPSRPQARATAAKSRRASHLPSPISSSTSRLAGRLALHRPPSIAAIFSPRASSKWVVCRVIHALGRRPGAGKALRAPPLPAHPLGAHLLRRRRRHPRPGLRNADLAKASQNREVIAFADHWRQVSGHDPALLIFDSKLTSQAVLAELDDREIGFITLRARHPGVTKALAALPATAWTSMTLGRAGGKTRRVKVHDDPTAQLSAYPRPIRQLAVTGLGHDQPTLLITNRPALPARQVIQSYARRMNIEQRLAEAIQSFSLDALAGAVPLNVDLDVVLSVLAHTLCAALRRRLPGYGSATPDTLQRRFLNTGGIILNRGHETVVRLNRRTYSPVLRQASLPETITVPWWKGRTLRYEYA